MPPLILIAEDDPGTRLAVQDYLELSGYTTIAVANGREALAHLQAHPPQLLIADIKMPCQDGYELVRQVRQVPQLRLLPVIFLTHRDSTWERILGYEVGCDVYLPKPFEMAELGAIVRNLIARSQAMQSEQHLSQPVGWRTENREATDFNFSQREWQVLEGVAEGHSNVEIGKQLHLSPRTVEKYVSSLLRKTTTHNRAELIRFALTHNLVR